MNKTYVEFITYGTYYPEDIYKDERDELRKNYKNYDMQDYARKQVKLDKKIAKEQIIGDIWKTKNGRRYFRYNGVFYKLNKSKDNKKYKIDGIADNNFFYKDGNEDVYIDATYPSFKEVEETKADYEAFKYAGEEYIEDKHSILSFTPHYLGYEIFYSNDAFKRLFF